MQTVAMVVKASLDIRPLSPVIGAEIGGLDLSSPLDPEVVAMVREALVHHLVIFFRDQDLTPEQQAAFGRQFGELTSAHPVLASLDGHPQVLPIDSRLDRASWWHTDVTFLSTPPLGSILYMREVPDSGGDTMWISMQAAYDGLSEPMRAFCDKLIAWHHDPFFAEDVEAKGGYEWDGKHHERLFPTSHPVVREHPETGRKGLFVNPQFTRFLEGLSQHESETLLEMLYRHCVEEAGVQLQVPLAPGIGGVLGQPGDDALCARRLRRCHPGGPPRDPAGAEALRARKARGTGRVAGRTRIAGPG